ncbi:MAG: hypothetical protein K2O63_07385 [Alistipes sp.]|nr:hypothetical protein [Alistipes sp.]
MERPGPVGRCLRRLGLALWAAGWWLDVSAQVTASADFDSGSMGRMRVLAEERIPMGRQDSVGVLSIEVRSRVDPVDPHDPQAWPSSRWFHFRLQGVKDKLLLLRIPNTELERPFCSHDGIDYRRMDSGALLRPQTLLTAAGHDTLYFAYFLPYTHERHEAKAEQWSRSPFVGRREIGRSGKGMPLTMLVVTDPEVPDDGKRRIWLHSRVHTSEAPAAWHLEAMIEELLADRPFSRQLLRNAIFYIVPETNPDGVIGGYSRTTAEGINLETDWNRPDSLTSPEVAALKRTIARLADEEPMDVVLNLHSQRAPFVTYWIHTPESSSQQMYRRKMLLSALTIDCTPYYRPIDQRFSRLDPQYAEGWLWERYGERTLAVTFETTYSYYNADPQGEWVSAENLAELAHSSLLALSDLLDLGGEVRLRLDSEGESGRGWELRSDDGRLFFGDSYRVARRKGAVYAYSSSEALPAGRYAVWKWVPGALAARFPEGENCWKPLGVTVRHRKGPLRFRYRATAAGDLLDAVLLVRIADE